MYNSKTEIKEAALIPYLWGYANDVYRVNKLHEKGKTYQKGHTTIDYHVSNTDGVAFYWYHGLKRLIVSWVGTKNLKAWKENFDGIDRAEISYSMARVHEGFWEGYISLRDKVKEALKSAIDNKYSIYITGHSRGGGQGTINAWDFMRSRYSLDKEQYLKKVIVFAAPKQGGKRYKHSVETILGHKLLRVNTKYDLVPKLKIQTIAGYRHAGRARILETGPFPFIPITRSILNHTQKCYTKYIRRLK